MMNRDVWQTAATGTDARSVFPLLAPVRIGFWRNSGAPDGATEMPAGDVAVGAVHVWLAGAETTASLIDDVPAAERARFDALRDPRERVRRLAAHGLLRHVLGRYTGTRPSSLRFATDPLGRPSLEPPHDGLAFSLSHGGEWTAIAVVAAERARVGIDVEPLADLADLDAVIDATFAPDVAAELRRTAPARRRRLFFERWTAQEAALKAAGRGFLGGCPRLAGLTGDARSSRRIVELSGIGHAWLVGLAPAADHVGTLAVLPAAPPRRRFAGLERVLGHGWWTRAAAHLRA